MAHVGVSRQHEQGALKSDHDLRADANEAMRRTDGDLTTVLVETLRWALSCLNDAEWLSMHGGDDDMRIVVYMKREERLQAELLRRRS
jgi:hypothetical protein